jgi:hypothetical protein
MKVMAGSKLYTPWQLVIKSQLVLNSGVIFDVSCDIHISVDFTPRNPAMDVG